MSANASNHPLQARQSIMDKGHGKNCSQEHGSLKCSNFDWWELLIHFLSYVHVYVQSRVKQLVLSIGLATILSLSPVKSGHLWPAQFSPINAFFSVRSTIKLITASTTYWNLYGIILYNDQTSPGTVRGHGSSRKGELTMASSNNKLLLSRDTNGFTIQDSTLVHY